MRPSKLGVLDANDNHVVTVISGKGGHSGAAFAGNNHIFAALIPTCCDPHAAWGGVVAEFGVVPRWKPVRGN